ncbi:hypothetical protein [Candidatus Minimicrobia naudis]
MFSWIIAGWNDGWRAIRQETGNYRVAARIIGLRIESWSMWFWRESSPQKTTEVARRK